MKPLRRFLLPLVVALMLVGLGAVAQARTRAEREDDVREVVFRHIMPKRYETEREFKVFFLSVEEKNPSERLLKRFAGWKTPVKRRSAAYEDRHAKDWSWSFFKDKATDQAGVMYSTGKIAWLGTDTVRVRAGYLAGGLNAASALYTLRFRRGHWRVVSSTDHVVS